MGLCKSKGKTKAITITEEAKSPMDLWYMNTLRTGLTIIDSWPYEALGEIKPWNLPILQQHKVLLVLWFTTFSLMVWYIRLYHASQSIFELGNSVITAMINTIDNNLPILQQHKVLLVLWLTTFSLMVWYIRLYHASQSIFELGNSVITAMINTIDNYRVTMIMTKSYREATRALVKEAHLFHYRHDSEYSMKIYNKMNRISNMICIYQLILVVNAAIFFNLMPLVININSGMLSSHPPANVTFVHAIYYAMPFDTFTWVPGYIITALLSVALSIWVAICFSMFDFYLAAIVCQVWGHLDVIQYELKTMPLPKNGTWYSPEESEEISAILKRNMHHHATIIKFVQKCSTAFGPMLALSFAFYQIGCCLLLLMCSTIDSQALAKFGLTIVVYLQLINFSVLFEFLGTKSENMINSVYLAPWEYMGVRERRYVLLFLMNVQTPIRLKALGLVPVGVNTMAAIMKTSISYFVMLKTFAE